MQLAFLFIIPFLGTVLGSAAIYLFPGGLGKRSEKLIVGFAAGVMMAASVWSLLLPAIDDSSYYTAAAGFAAGIAFLLIIDSVMPHLHIGSDKSEGRKGTGLGKSALLMLAVTIHNIPEGMAVGAGASQLISDSSSFASALALSLGIALQNFPEGMVVSFPLYKEGKSKGKAFLQGVLSGAVEPAGAVIAFFLVSALSGAFLPFFLSFAAGAMIYVVVEELIPESSEGEHSNIGTIGVASGFIVMMLLDGIFG